MLITEATLFQALTLLLSLHCVNISFCLLTALRSLAARNCQLSLRSHAVNALFAALSRSLWLLTRRILDIPLLHSTQK